MINYIITSSSTIDLAPSILQKEKYDLLYFNYTLDNQQYLDDFGKSLSYEEFYNKLAISGNATTSQLNYYTYYEFFEKYLKQDISIIHIELSSGLSNSLNNALMAANDLNDKYQSKVLVVDSLLACGAQGMLFLKALEKQKAGYDFQACFNYIQQFKLCINCCLYTNDLSQLVKGGRVSKTNGFIASSLGIAITITFDNGKLKLYKKCLGKKKALLEVENLITKNLNDNSQYNEIIVINHAHNLEDALKTKEFLLKKFPNCKDIYIFDIGSIIGSHTGKNSVAVSFVEINKSLLID